MVITVHGTCVQFLVALYRRLLPLLLLALLEPQADVVAARVNLESSCQKGMTGHVLQQRPPQK